MAIGVPDFSRGAQSPIDLAFALDRRQGRGQDGGMFGSDPIRAALSGMQINQAFGDPQGFGPLAGLMTVGGGGGVTMPQTGGGLPAPNKVTY